MWKITSFVGKYWELGALTGFVGSIILSERVTEVILLNLSDKEFVLSDIKCDDGIFDIEKMPPVQIYRSTRSAYAIGSNQYFGGVSCQIVYIESNTKAELTISTDNWYFGGNYGKAHWDGQLGIKVDLDVGSGWKNQVKVAIRNK